FLDMQMPVLDGYDCAKLLRTHGLNIPIVAVTASAMDGAPERCLQAGCDEYIRKPFTQQAINDVLAKYLCGRRVEKMDVEQPSPIIHSNILKTSPKMAPIVLGFVKRLPERLGSMEKSYREENWKELRAIVHNLAGADMFGFSGLRIAAEAVSA